MRFSLVTFIAILGACSPAAPALSPPPAPPASSAVAPARLNPPAAPTLEQVKDEVVAQINEPTADGLYDLFGPPMRQLFTAKQTATFSAQIREARGRWRNAKRAPGDDSADHGTWRIDAERGAWQLEIHVDGDAKITGLKVTPAAPEQPVARSRQALGLPFRGEWSVLWGGDREEDNRHVTNVNQRRAADLVMVGVDGKTHRGDGRQNQDYLAYGQEILAVADGTVVTVVDGVPENEPGAPNPSVVPGNYILVRHSDSLYSAYEHLQPGKIAVRQGENVRRGAAIGSCGNSGNSTEPHLHFQLQDGPTFDRSSGVEAVFDDVLVTRAGKAERSKDYVFRKDDRLRAAP